jgi:hypothetical protein
MYASRRSSWDGEAAAGLTFALVAIVILVAYVMWKVTEATLKEIGRIYTERGHGPTGRRLWHALGALAGFWLICGIVASVDHAAVGSCGFCAAWAFLAYVLFIEVTDWQARRGEPKPGDLGSLDTYLGSIGLGAKVPTSAPRPATARSPRA